MMARDAWEWTRAYDGLRTPVGAASSRDRPHRHRAGKKQDIGTGIAAGSRSYGASSTGLAPQLGRVCQIASTQSDPNRMLRPGDQPISGMGWLAASLKGISSVMDRQPKASAT